MKLDDIINRFIWSIKIEKNLSKNTIISYNYDLDEFKKYLKEICYLETEILNDEILQNFILKIKEQNSHATLKRKIICIMQFLKFAKKENLLNSDIKNRPKIKQEKTYATFLEESDLEIIRSSLKENNFENARLNFIIEVFYSTGLRVSELISLKRDQKEEILKNFKIEITGKGNKKRFIFFNNKSIDAIIRLDFYLKDNDIYFINLTRQRVFQILKKLAVKLNISHEKIYPHSFRHRMLTDLVKKGVNLIAVQKIAGHSQISTTEKYTHVEDFLYEEIEKYHPIFKFVN